MKHYILLILCLFVCSTNIYSQNKTVEASGVVLDDFGEPLPGVNITVKDAPGLGVISDVDGRYRIKVEPYSFLIFSYIGFENQEQLIKEEDIVINITMQEDQKTVLDEVTITGTGPQKKITLTGAITTVDVNTLKTPTSSIANALAGNVAGVMAMQTSGQPGNNTSEFWIRGISTFGGGSSALVLVDGFERSLNEINVEDIESFTVLKDASTTAIYGSRGANGVIIITTKRGRSGKVEVDAKAEYTYTTRTYTPKFVDGSTYASLMNEALTTRNRQPVYSDDELMMIREGLDPDLYPNVDWMGLLLKKGAPTYRASVNVKGGSSTTSYYLSGSYLNEGGMYNQDDAVKDYKTNANYERYNYRLNLDMKVTESTLLKVGVAGTLEKQNHPGAGSDHIWYSALGYNPVLIPVVYSNGYIPTYRRQDDDDFVEQWYSPWTVATQTGYAETWKNKIQTNITLEQKLDFITKGLHFNARFGYDTYNQNYIQRRKNPEMWRAERLRDSNGNQVFTRMVTERLMQQFSSASGQRNEFFEAELLYNRTFGDHSLNGIIKYTQDAETNTSNIGEDFIKGIDRRHQGLAGNVGYGYKNRYYFNFNFGYNGSENFAKGHQFGFFPAYSAAWNIAEEKFIKDNVSWLEMFKIRYSYGKTGNDNIGKDNADERFPYLAQFGYPEYKPMDGKDGRPKYAYNWGDLNTTFAYDGLTNTRVSSNNVSWEYAKKHDIGVDIYLMGDKFGFTVDYFNERRDGIYMQRNYLPEMVGLQSSNPYANLGSVKSKGFDGNFSYVEKVGEVNLTLRGNFTYSKNEILEADEQYSNYPYTRKAGYRVDQAKGLIAQGLFKDYDEIRRSPTQFGDVMPGDIKYKDINGDGVINDDDIVPIGATTKPNLIYGFGLSVAWKGVDVNVHFQGAGKSNFMTNGFTVYPFSAGEWGNILTDVIDSGRWILGENEDPNAKYPRLSYDGNDNNYRPSTHWLRDGSYLRLKTLEAGYTLPRNLTNKVMLRNVRIYFIGQNLLTFAKFKLWDPEMGSSNGQKYPLGKTYTVGLSVNI